MLGRRVYVSGPMRGRPLFNFPAFHAAADELRNRGYEVYDPAAVDEALGFDPTRPISATNPCDMDAAIRRDVDAILWADIVLMLPGWESSRGATAECAVAEWAGKRIETMDTIGGSPWE